MKRPLFFLPAVAVLLLLATFGESSCGIEPPVPHAVGYPDSVGQILSLHCLNEGCHNATDKASGLSLESWAEAMQGSEWGSVIIPYNPDHSHIFQHINSFADLGPQATPAMPSEGNRLSRAEVKALQHWMEHGAHSADSTYYWQAEETSTSGKMVVLCQGEDLMAVVDLKSNQLMRLQSVGSNPGAAQVEAPHYVTASPDGQYLYLTLIQGGVLERRRATDYTLVGQLALGNNSEASIISLSPDGTRAVVTLFGSGSEDKIVLINTQTMQVIDRLSGPGICEQAHGIAASADFRTLWITAWAGNYITRVNLAADRNSFLSDFERIPLVGEVAQDNGTLEPYWIMLSPDEQRVFVSCSKTNEVVVVNTATQAVETRVSTGKFPRQFVLDAVGNRLFVACKKEESFTQQGSLQGCISVISLSPTIAFAQNIYNVGQNPHGIGLDHARNRLWSTSENTTGTDTAHHVTVGTSIPGFAHATDLTTLKVQKAEQIELAGYAASLYIAK